MSQFHTFDTTQIWSVLSIFTPHRQNSGIVTCPKRYEFLKFNLLSKMEKNCDFTSKMANFKGPNFFFHYTLGKKSCALSHICWDLSFGTAVRQFEIFPKSSSGPTVLKSTTECLIAFLHTNISTSENGKQLKVVDITTETFAVYFLSIYIMDYSKS